jgi:hypothetical protein
MAADFELVARVLARSRGRAIPIRETFYLSPDPPVTFGIAPIRVVAEEMVQAVAYGSLGDKPEVLTRWDPLAREAEELRPFAQALDRHTRGAVSRGLVPRVWLPHRAALALIEMLGYRYRNNRRASDDIQLMGGQCAALFAEWRRPGQQVVAVAGELLRTHVVSGQSPAKDHHLRALLEWIDPQHGVDPESAADTAAIQPASAMLMRHADDEVEGLRETAKEGGPGAAEARERIGLLLTQGALDEWQLLEAGRAAYWGLGLSELPGWEPEEDAWRFRRIAEGRHWRPSRADDLSTAVLDEQQAAEVLDDREIRYDRLIREKARMAGRAVVCQLVAIDQPISSRKPCHFRLETTQDVLRVRRGTKLSSIDGAIEIRVDAVEHAQGGPVVISADVTKGVLRSVVPRVGSTLELVDSAPFGGNRMKREIYYAMKDHAHPLVFGTELPSARPRPTSVTDLRSALEGGRGV